MSLVREQWQDGSSGARTTIDISDWGTSALKRDMHPPRREARYERELRETCSCDDHGADERRQGHCSPYSGGGSGRAQQVNEPPHRARAPCREAATSPPRLARQTPNLGVNYTRLLDGGASSRNYGGHDNIIIHYNRDDGIPTELNLTHLALDCRWILPRGSYYYSRCRGLFHLCILNLQTYQSEPMSPMKHLLGEGDCTVDIVDPVEPVLDRDLLFQ